MPEHAHPSRRFSQFMERARNQDLMVRHGLSTDQRFAVLLAGITALPLDASNIEREFTLLLEEGCDPVLAEDTLTQMAAYLGYPKVRAALEGFARAAKQHDVFVREAPPEITNSDRYQQGITDYSRLNPDALNTIKAAFGEISGNIIDLTFQSFGDVYASSSQPLTTRQLATVSALAVLGGVAPQLRFHMGAALRVGVSHQQIIEVLAWVQFLAGMPAAYNALIELKAALAEGIDAPPAYR